MSSINHYPNEMSLDTFFSITSYEGFSKSNIEYARSELRTLGLQTIGELKKSIIWCERIPLGLYRQISVKISMNPRLTDRAFVGLFDSPTPEAPNKTSSDSTSRETLLTWDEKQQVYLGSFTKSDEGVIGITLRRTDTFGDINNSLMADPSSYKDSHGTIINPKTKITPGTYSTVLFGRPQSIRISKIVHSTLEIETPPFKRLKTGRSKMESFWKFLPEAVEDEQGFIRLTNNTHILGTENFGSEIYVRKAYTDLWKIITDLISQKVTKFGILGTSGIGKSFFLYYILWKLVKFELTIVVSRNGHPLFEVFEKGKVFRCHPNDALEYLDDPKCWYLVDSESVILCDAITILISSPSPVGLSLRGSPIDNKEFLKQDCAHKFMPTWSLEELLKVGITLKGYEKGKLIALYERWGGTASRVLNRLTHNNLGNPNQEQLLEAEIERADLESIIQASTNIDQPSTISDKLVHYRIFDNYSQYATCFSSEYVTSRIYSKLCIYPDCVSLTSSAPFNWEGVRKIRSLVQESNSPYLRGSIFEKHFHTTLTGGVVFRYKKLGTSETGVLRIKERKEDLFDDLDGLEFIPDGIYARPREINSQMVTSGIKPSTLFQTTISKNHPVNKQRLLEVMNKMGSTGIFRLFFVVSQDIYGSFGLQNYVDDNSKVLGDQSFDAIEQYALEMMFYSSDFHYEKSITLTL